MILQSELELRTPSETVSLEEGKEILNKLKDELSKSEVGVGLSAPQLGLFKKVAIIQTSNGFLEVINSKILKLEDPFINLQEGCLSFPGIRINTIRFHKILMEDDLNGQFELNHFASVIAQHEQDHLDGVLFFDRRVPEMYDQCFCGSKNKFKFCCKSKVR